MMMVNVYKQIKELLLQKKTKPVITRDVENLKLILF